MKITIKGKEHSIRNFGALFFTMNLILDDSSIRKLVKKHNLPEPNYETTDQKNSVINRIADQVLTPDFFKKMLDARPAPFTIGFEIARLPGKFPNHIEIIEKRVLEFFHIVGRTTQDIRSLIRAFPQLKEKFAKLAIIPNYLSKITENGKYLSTIKDLINSFPEEKSKIIILTDKMIISDFFETNSPKNFKNHLKFRSELQSKGPLPNFREQLDNYCKATLSHIEENEPLGKHSERYQQALTSQVIAIAQTGDMNTVKQMLKLPYFKIQNGQLLSAFAVGGKTFRQFVMESNDPELVKRLQPNSVLVTDKNGATQCKTAIDARYLLDENVARVKTLQRAIAGHYALRALYQKSGLDLEKSSNKNKNKVDFTRDSDEIKALYQIVAEQSKEMPYKLPYKQSKGLPYKQSKGKQSKELPYKMKHTVKNDEVFDSILESGKVLSQRNVEQETEKESTGINNKFDRNNLAHLFVFWGMGVNKSNLPIPDKLNSEANAYIIIDAERWHKISPAQSRFHVTKGIDGGARKGHPVNIPGTNATMEVSYQTECGAHGGHSKYSSQEYRYERNGIVYQWTLYLLDEVTTGNDYKNLVPDLIGRHLMKLPFEEQKEILASIKAAGNSPKKQRDAVKALVDAFYQLESSIGGYLPLAIEYVDFIKFPGEKEKPISIKKLRYAAETGDQAFVMVFLEENKSLSKRPWIIEGIYRIAKQNKHDQLLTWITPQYAGIVIPSQQKGLYLVPEALQQIRTLQQLILEGENPHLTVDFDTQKNQLLFTNHSNKNQKNKLPNQQALINLQHALGESINASKNTKTVPSNLGECPNKRVNVNN